MSECERLQNKIGGLCAYSATFSSPRMSNFFVLRCVGVTITSDGYVVETAV